ncbi:unnamed protein product [Symbiodinium sp. CCMP2456]|nr:unnamed protein product [Symbiodinium sp. CCMP2456]
MAAPALTAVQQGHLETLAPDLRFQLEQADVPAVLQARLGELGIRNVALFSGLDESRERVRAALIAELPIDPTAGVAERLNVARLLAAWEASRLHLQVSEKNKAEARLGTQQRLVQPNEHHAMRLAVEAAVGKLKDKEVPAKSVLAAKLEQIENNQPVAELLTEVASLEDSELEAYSAVIDPTTNVLKIKPGKTLTGMPDNPEELRLRHRRIGLAWDFLATKHALRPWLSKNTTDVLRRFSDYVLGSQVAGLVAGDGHTPTWSMVLHFELEARKSVYRWIRDGEALSLEDAFSKATHDMELLNRHLVIPFSLRAVPPPPTAPSAWERAGKPLRTPGKRTIAPSAADTPPAKKAAKLMKTPDGKPICWKYNRKEGCTNTSCRFIHDNDTEENVSQGVSRRADLKSCLADACHAAGLTFRCHEVDIQRDEAQDVLSDSFWLRLLNQVRRHEFTIIFMSPPCSTFSRATFSNRSGPPPLRNSDWPEGFPWLSGTLKAKAEAGTMLVRRALSLATLASSENIPWLLEHPEFLGATDAGTPASIWMWEEAVQVFQATRATTVAFHQCAYGADHRKPTRVAGTWHGLRTLGVAGWPRLDRAQRYRGPLSRTCGHKHTPLIGTDEHGDFRTAPTAAYPPELCKALASLAMLTHQRTMSSESGTGEKQARSSDTLENATSSAKIHPAEALAACQSQGEVSCNILLEMFELLPGENMARDGVTWNDSKSFAIGAYAVGGSLSGLRRNSRVFPGVARVLCNFVRSLDASFTFTAVGIFRNLQTAPHRDSGNERGSRNLVAGLSSFRGGGIWTQDGGGQEACPSDPSLGPGRTLEIDSGGHIVFDPSVWHCTQAWKGTRTVLVAYTPRVNESFPAAEWEQLGALGFNLPARRGASTLGP